MRGEIVEGDFPKGAILAPAGLIEQDVRDHWVDGCSQRQSALKIKLKRLNFWTEESSLLILPVTALLPWRAAS